MNQKHKRSRHEIERYRAFDKWTPEAIVRLRERLGYSSKPADMEAFGNLLGVSGHTVNHWEYARGKPSGSACILLEQLHKKWKNRNKVTDDDDETAVPASAPDPGRGSQEEVGVPQATDW